MTQAAAKTFRDLLVWQKAHAFALSIYHLSEGFPRDERYGVTAQLRRAAVSIPANIVEGFRKRSEADKLRFFNIAQGSADETLYFLILANDLKFADTHSHQLLIEEISRLLQAYMSAFER